MSQIITNVASFLVVFWLGYFILRLLNEKTALIAKNAVLEANLEQEKAKIIELKHMKEESLLQFKAISADILKSQSADLANSQNEKMSVLLTPLKDQIETFKKRMEDIHQTNTKDKGRLDEQFNNLLLMNQQLSAEATNLTSALKGNAKKQGDWGEIQLERIFELIGFVKGRDYTAQECVGTERKRTDFIVNLPYGRRLIVDCKVSLNAYTRYIEAQNEEDKNQALVEHAKALENHIKNLASKEYQKEIEGLDFVFMFIPIEHAYLEAVRFNPNLSYFAGDNKIALTTGSSLLASLRIVEHLWRIEKQNKNVQEIAMTGGRLYDKLAGFVDDMCAIDKAIDKAKESYTAALNKLSKGRGNALGLAEKLKFQGAKTSKILGLIDIDDQIDENTDQ